VRRIEEHYSWDRVIRDYDGLFRSDLCPGAGENTADKRLTV